MPEVKQLITLLDLMRSHTDTRQLALEGHEELIERLRAIFIQIGDKESNAQFELNYDAAAKYGAEKQLVFDCRAALARITPQITTLYDSIEATLKKLADIETLSASALAIIGSAGTESNAEPTPRDADNAQGDASSDALVSSSVVEATPSEATTADAPVKRRNQKPAYPTVPMGFSARNGNFKDAKPPKDKRIYQDPKNPGGQKLNRAEWAEKYPNEPIPKGVKNTMEAARAARLGKIGIDPSQLTKPQDYDDFILLAMHYSPGLQTTDMKHEMDTLRKSYGEHKKHDSDPFKRGHPRSHVMYDDRIKVLQENGMVVWQSPKVFVLTEAGKKQVESFKKALDLAGKKPMADPNNSKTIFSA